MSYLYSFDSLSTLCVKKFPEYKNDEEIVEYFGQYGIIKHITRLPLNKSFILVTYFERR